MDKLDIQELRSKTSDQLSTMIEEYKKELMNLRFQLSSGTLTNTSRISKVRKMIAKIKTLINNEQSEKDGDKK